MPKSFVWQEFFVQSKDSTRYESLSNQHITVTELDEEEMVKVAPEVLTLLVQQAFYEASFFLCAGHLKQIASILHDPQASSNDRHVVLQPLHNVEVSTKGILPNCQDTGTVTIVASKEQHIWTSGDDAEASSKSVYSTFTRNSLRYSQNAPLDMYTEVNTQINLPAQIDISAILGNEYRFLFVNKGDGSANKAALFQEIKSILQPEKLTAFLIEKMKSLGAAACPPYHTAFVVGGLSTNQALKAAKLASTRCYDNLPTSRNELGQAFRDTALEAELLNTSRELGIGAQFSGKYFTHNVRVIHLPRHGGSCPIAVALFCSADRNIKAKINKRGIWLEKLEHNPGKFVPDSHRTENGTQTVQLDLNRPLHDILHSLSALPIGTRLLLSGPIVVAHDIAHANIKARLDNGEPMPEYMKKHIVYYAGPAKIPESQACGSMGPTTGGRMDGYVGAFQAQGGDLTMLTKGNRSQQVTDACHRHGGFSLGSIGGAATLLAQQYVKSLRCLEYPELEMEAVWMMEVKNMPAFALVDDKGNNFFSQFEQQHRCTTCPAGH